MYPFWIETNNALRLAIVPRPRGGEWLEDDLHAVRRAGVDVIVSMLTLEEAAELGLAREADACAIAGLAFKRFAIPDRQVPSSDAPLTVFLAEIRGELHKGNSIAVHCRASIGRSSLFFGCSSVLRRVYSGGRLHANFAGARIAGAGYARAGAVGGRVRFDLRSGMSRALDRQSPTPTHQSPGGSFRRMHYIWAVHAATDSRSAAVSRS